MFDLAPPGSFSQLDLYTGSFSQQKSY